MISQLFVLLKPSLRMSVNFGNDDSDGHNLCLLSSANAMLCYSVAYCPSCILLHEAWHESQALGPGLIQVQYECYSPNGLSLHGAWYDCQTLGSGLGWA